MSHTRKLFVAILLCTLGVVATTAPAGADVISIPLVTPINFVASGGLLSNLPGPYGEIRVNLLDSTDALITFAGRTVGSNVYRIFMGVNFIYPNSSAFSATDFTTTSTGTGFLTPGPFIALAFGLGGLEIINTSPGFPDEDFLASVDSFTFTLHNFSTPEWATATDVLRFDPLLGFQASRVEIEVTNSPANVANGRILAGFALPPQGPPFIPNAGTLLLLSVGFLLSLALGRRLVTLRRQ